MEALLNSFALVFVSEMGDKTQLMALVLALRFRRPWIVLAGIAVAALVNLSLAAFAGVWLGTIAPTQTLRWVVAVAFFICGIWTLIPDKTEADESPKSGKYGAFLTTAVLFFLAEMGDKTQLATVALGARYQQLLTVAFAATVGIVAADALVVFLGEKLHARLQMKWVRRGASLLFIFFGFYLLLFAGESARAQTLEISGPNRSAKLTLYELKRKLKTQTVRVDDPVYKKSMTYDGFALSEVFALAGLGPDGTADELVFTALDGYAPNMSFAAMKERKGYLVYQEHGLVGQFSRVDQGKTKLSPGPFYVVWENGKGDVPWPYQLAKVEAVAWATKYPRVVPPKVSAESSVMKGFVLFKNDCIRCHSINLQGGDVGPELNAPQNVTEYWRPEVLRDFIRDAPGFRFKSKMPSFSHLKSEQLDHLIAYLTHMKTFKIQTATP